MTMTMTQIISLPHLHQVTLTRKVRRHTNRFTHHRQRQAQSVQHYCHRHHHHCPHPPSSLHLALPQATPMFLVAGRARLVTFARLTSSMNSREVRAN